MIRKQIDTLALAEEHRVSAWEGYLETALFTARCTPLNGLAFQGLQTDDKLGQIGVAEVRTTSHVLEHKPKDSACEGDTLVSILLEGEVVMGQAGQWLHLAPGDIMGCPSNLPFTYICIRPMHALVLRIPVELFHLIHGAPLEGPVLVERRAGTRRFDQQALAQDLAQWIRAESGKDAPEMQNRILGIVEALLQSGTISCSGRSHFLAAIAFIVDHLHEAKLTPDDVAMAVNLSPRQLHRIFSQQRTSVMAEISSRRLQRAMLMLKDPALSSIPVAEIGYRCGFSGPAVFSRVFRDRFGLSPKSARLRKDGAVSESS